ncbi:major facilitator superfamily MFS_1 [Deinococcus proteolyticus MRP]|uniref:Major facilitator superfamily MFS_1 n=1 Tax=Deinococcus proteolyticus (strain ATCC 35074 / DSM 20540 / JCM 6276 / NBRC 101906 / NCIMB 13154 / VKM Ac-1939 / CCM 2703 / MRP) TaxID=693977 RepID=F0RPE2_DEIPM|nr:MULTISPECIES: MFS transporter [Deinococcus]ADY26485.1 major facilitator superfamily MFS_1 [Deinococcus proteolyticus MRP]MCY1702603.1 MFS transporter [Deinococcus sp. SL84]
MDRPSPSSTRQTRLFLAASFSFGLSQAFVMLFLNFYLGALGLGPEWQGIINALPALTLAAVSLPLVVLARRLSNARVIQLGAVLSVLGLALLALAPGALLAVAGALLQGMGSAALAVSGAPFMANNSTEKTRVRLFTLQSALMVGAGFVGNLLGGQLPGLYAGWTGADPGGLGALRTAMLVAAALQLLGALPTLGLQPSGKPAQPGRSGALSIQDRRTMFRLVLPTVFVGLGAGATIPFLNVYIEGRFGISYASLGTLFAWTSLATAVTVLIQPWLVRRLGQLGTVLAVQASSLPFLVLLGFAPYLWMVTLALFMRGALMNATGPVYSSYAMSVLPEADRPMYSATNTILWSSCWALASLASGALRAAGWFDFGTNFNILFAFTLLMYLANTLAVYLGVYLPDRRGELRSTESAGEEPPTQP